MSLLITEGLGSEEGGGGFVPIVGFDVYFDFQAPQGVYVENVDFIPVPIGLKVEEVVTIVPTPQGVLVTGVVVVPVPLGFEVEDLDYVPTPAGLAVEEV